MRSRGTRREREVERLLRAEGYLTASLRHLGGAGDLLALPPLTLEVPPAIIEVKGTAELPWRHGWNYTERLALQLRAEAYGAEPLLAWWPPGIGSPVWLPVEDWPIPKVPTQSHLDGSG